jgi:hypothetical protein
MRRLPHADLGDIRHHHARLEGRPHGLVPGRRSDGEPLRRYLRLQLQRQLGPERFPRSAYKSAWFLVAKLLAIGLDHEPVTYNRLIAPDARA